MKNKVQLLVAIAAFALTQDVFKTILIGAAFWLLTVNEIHIKRK
jgi:hypothetical protein